MKMILSRRDFVRSGALAAGACATSTRVLAAPTMEVASPVRLGLASYTFRNFDRAQLIGFMKQLNVSELNAKDVKDHLPMDPTEPAYSFTRPAPSISPKTTMRTFAASSNTANELRSRSSSRETRRRRFCPASRSS
jgi:hypothetical protein